MTALALVLLVFSRPWPCVAAQASDSTGVPLGVVRVVQARLPIPVDNARRSFKVGDRAQLFQENEEFFIALVDKPFDSKLLVAVPLRKGGGKTAWVTPENVMFFGTEVAAVEGRYTSTFGPMTSFRSFARKWDVTRVLSNDWASRRPYGYQKLTRASGSYQTPRCLKPLRKSRI